MVRNEIEYYLVLMEMDSINWKSLNEKKFLITGGLGFVGINLVSKLLENGIKPIVFDFHNDLSKLDFDYIPFQLDQIEYYNVNVGNQSELFEQIRKLDFDIVVHLASMTNLTKDFVFARKSIQINIIGTINLLEVVSDKQLMSFIYVSTSDVYGELDPPFKESQKIQPASPYSVSKAAAEMYALLFQKTVKIPVTILRSFNLFGKYQRPIRITPIIIDKLLKQEIVELTLGEQKRELNFVENLLDAIYLSIIKKESVGKIINIGNGKSHSIRNIAELIANKLQRKDLLKFGAIPYRPNEIWDMYCDNSLSKEILDWTPKTSLEDGLDITIEWFKSKSQK